MKNIVAYLALTAVLGSGQALASDLADGFNWPEGFSSEVGTVADNSGPVADGFNWPEGFNSDVRTVSRSSDDVADGFNWPEGF